MGSADLWRYWFGRRLVGLPCEDEKMVRKKEIKWMIAAYYNEHDQQKAEVIKQAIQAGVIAPGEVDTRSIVDVRADDLRGFAQCHFFAGGGIWSYALRLAGWADDWPIWTGSCPCQPFSVAGRRKGKEDERHLWPEFLRLIRDGRPLALCGEQVANGDGLVWVDDVLHDLETTGYGSWAVDSPACGYGAPHIRQRLYWGARMADDAGIGRDGRRAGEKSGRAGEPGGFRDAGGLADTEQFARQWAGPTEASRGRPCDQLAGPGDVGGLEHAEGNGREQRGAESGGRGTAGGCGSGGVGVAHGERFAQRMQCNGTEESGSEASASWIYFGGSSQNVRGPVNGFWSGADWVLVRPQRLGDSLSIRPVNRATFPLAPGTPGRVLGLRVAGDAINAEQAAAFIKASWEFLRQ